jgi:hypothetical protein
MLQRNCLLRFTALTASLLLLSACAESTRDVSPWSHLLPSDGGSSVVAMALDPQGEPAVTGALVSEVETLLGPPDGTGAGVFVAMMSDAGDVLWGGAGAALGTQGRGVAVAPNGDVLLLGTFSDRLNLGGQELAPPDGSAFPSTATFLARFDPRGKLLWSKPIANKSGVEGADESAAQGTSLAISANGDAIVGGYFLQNVTAGGDYILQTQAGFVARFDADGNTLWGRTMRGASTAVTAVTVDESGAVIVAGSDSGLYVDVYQSPHVGDPNLFVTKLTSGGELLFTTLVHGTGATPSYIRALATGPSGEIVISGVFIDNLIFGSQAFTTSAGPEGFLAQLSPAGVPGWVHPIKAPFGHAEALALAVGPNGRVYAAGSYQGDELSIAGLSLGPTSAISMFLVELDAAGKPTDGRLFDHAGQYSAGRALAFDPAGALVLAGHFVGQIDLDDQTLTSAPRGSSFVTRLALPFASHRRE